MGVMNGSAPTTAFRKLTVLNVINETDFSPNERSAGSRFKPYAASTVDYDVALIACQTYSQFSVSQVA